MAPELQSRPVVRRASDLAWALLPVVALVFVFAGTWRALDAISDSGPVAPPQPPPTLSGGATQLAVITVEARRAATFVRTQASRPIEGMSVPAEAEVVLTLPEFQPQ